jgi:hypothetical protein
MSSCRWSGERALRVTPPVARIETSDPDAIAYLIRRKISRSSGRFVVAICGGSVYAIPAGNLAALSMPVDNVVGIYTRSVEKADLADDLRYFIESHATREAA